MDGASFLCKSGLKIPLHVQKYRIACIEGGDAVWQCLPMITEPIQDTIDDLYHKAILATDEIEFDVVLAELRTALRDHYEELQSVSAEYLLTFPIMIRKRASRLREEAA